MTYIIGPMKIPTPGTFVIVDPADPGISVVAPITDDQKKLPALINRRHPDYEKYATHWEFLDNTYEGGREWFADGNIFRYIKEGEKEYADRVARCYRFNHTREVVDLLNKYLFKQNIVRNETDAPASVVAFWKKSTKNGLGIRDFARQAGKKASIYGRIGIVIDNNAKGAVGSKADEKALGVRTYGYTVGPQQLLDYSYDDDGDLNWILIKECVRDDA